MKHQRGSSGGAKRRGLTMYELLATIAIMGGMSAMAVPKWSAYLQKQRLSLAASRVVADLARAQAAAYHSSTSQTMTFTVGSSQYTISSVKSLDLSSGTYTVVLSQDPYQCTLASVWGQAGTQTLTFNGYGLPNQGGSIVLTNGTLQKTIVVDPNSGLAVIQ